MSDESANCPLRPGVGGLGSGGLMPVNTTAADDESVRWSARMNGCTSTSFIALVVADTRLLRGTTS